MKYIICIFFFISLFSSKIALSQNQWVFLGGYLDEQPWWAGNHHIGEGIPSPLNKPAVREHCGSGIYKDKFWIFGGDGNGTGSDMWSYDTKTDCWTFVGDRGSAESHTDKMTESSMAHPGNRSRMASAMDKDGYFWIFGGATNDLGFHTGWNDLWKYNTNNNNWTWMGGDSTHSSIGSYQIANKADWPRARYRARGWFDQDGNYWIFGGLFYNGWNDPFPLNDMWKYNVSENIWTCETGNCNGLNPSNAPSGSYPATVGLSSVDYCPRARADYGYWLDYEGNFWLYGGADGDQHASGGSSALSDTWKYNPKTKEWTLITALGTYDSPTNPGGQIEPLCWLGNDGLPWMRLLNRSIWKLKNNIWENQQIFIGADRFAPPFDYSPSFHSYNQPGSQFTTFNHIKTDSAVYLYNGFGMNSSNTINYMGALWKYSLDIYPQPKLKVKILTDDFDPYGASPYTYSTREIIVKNIGLDTAHNVLVNVGLGPINNHSAIKMSSIEVRDSLTNTLISTIDLSGKPILIKGTENEMACDFDTSSFKSSVEIKIPYLTVGKTIKIIVVAEHCMANFYQPTNYRYSWNFWGVTAKYEGKFKKPFYQYPIYGDISKTLVSIKREKYQAPLTLVNSSSDSDHYVFEIGSGTKSNPTNNQDVGENMPNAQARLDLTLPLNFFLENGALTDIEGEYAIENATGIDTYKVNPVSIEHQYTEPNATQTYIMKFPIGRFLPIRRIQVKIRSHTGSSGAEHIIGRMLTTFNSEHTSNNYGWKAASH